MGLILSSLPAMAMETAVGGGPASSAVTAPENLPNYSQRQCEQAYHDNQCAQFFKENPELGQNAVDCSKALSPQKELVGCLSGVGQVGKEVWDFVYGIAAGIPSALQATGNFGAITPERQKQIDFFENCVASTECKVNLWETTRQQSASEERRAHLASIYRWPELEGMVRRNQRLRVQTTSFQVAEILNNQSLSEDEKIRRVRELDPHWDDRYKIHSENLWELSLNAAETLVKKVRCYKNEIKVQAACYGLASMVGLPIPASNIAKLAAVTNVARRTSKLDAVIPNATRETIEKAHLSLSRLSNEGSISGGEIASYLERLKQCSSTNPNINSHRCSAIVHAINSKYGEIQRLKAEANSRIQTGITTASVDKRITTISSPKIDDWIKEIPDTKVKKNIDNRIERIRSDGFVGSGNTTRNLEDGVIELKFSGKYRLYACVKDGVYIPSEFKVHSGKFILLGYSRTENDQTTAISNARTLAKSTCTGKT